MNKIKELENHLKALNENVAKVDQELRNLKHRRSGYIKKIQQTKESIRRQRNPEVTITDHAIIRYFERVMGLNIEDVKNHILTEETKGIIHSLNSCEIPLGNNVVAVVKNKSVITIKPLSDSTEAEGELTITKERKDNRPD